MESLSIIFAYVYTERLNKDLHPSWVRNKRTEKDWLIGSIHQRCHYESQKTLS